MQSCISQEAPKYGRPSLPLRKLSPSSVSSNSTKSSPSGSSPFYSPVEGRAPPPPLPRTPPIGGPPVQSVATPPAYHSPLYRPDFDLTTTSVNLILQPDLGATSTGLTTPPFTSTSSGGMPQPYPHFPSPLALSSSHFPHHQLQITITNPPGKRMTPTSAQHEGPSSFMMPSTPTVHWPYVQQPNRSPITLQPALDRRITSQCKSSLIPPVFISSELTQFNVIDYRRTA